MPTSSQHSAPKMQQPGPLDLERVSWDDMRLFVVTARHASFRKAATALRTSSSTVTRRVERLELDLGVRLFDRLPEGVALTKEGRQVLTAAEAMERASLTLRRYLDRDVTTRGLVRCSMTEGIGTFWMLPRMAEFHRANPYTTIDLKCTMDVADVLRLETDLAVQLIRPTSPDLVVTKLGRLHVYPFASRRYLDAYGAPTSIADLANHKIIDQTSPQFQDGVLQAKLGPGINWDGVVAVRTNASTAHYYAIELGIGVGVLPTYAVPLGADIVPLDIGLRHSVDIWLTYNPDVRSIPRVAMFIDWLREQFDPRRYPWFRDEFIHPNEFARWKPPQEDLRFDDEMSSIIAKPVADDSAAA